MWQYIIRLQHSWGQIYTERNAKSSTRVKYAIWSDAIEVYFILTIWRSCSESLWITPLHGKYQRSGIKSIISPPTWTWRLHFEGAWGFTIDSRVLTLRTDRTLIVRLLISFQVTFSVLFHQDYFNLHKFSNWNWIQFIAWFNARLF